MSVVQLFGRARVPSWVIRRHCIAYAIAQVDGKVRDKFEVPVDITEDALRDLAMASDAVKKAIGDKQIANVIVRAPKLVNIATK